MVDIKRKNKTMKTKIKISLPPVDILKETPEQRKERINSAGRAMFSRVVPNKKKLDRKKQRQQDKREVHKYDV